MTNVTIFFVILATAATLFTAGKHDIQSAAEAAEALRPLAGSAATILLALGLIGAGFLAVPILTGSSAYAVCEAFGWKCGLDQKLAGAKRFYALIVGATVCGAAINYMGINPVTALFWPAVLGADALQISAKARAASTSHSSGRASVRENIPRGISWMAKSPSTGETLPRTISSPSSHVSSRSSSRAPGRAPSITTSLSNW